MRAGLPIGEDDLQAYVDGRLAPDRAAEVAAYLGERPELEARLAAYRAQSEALRERLRPVAQAPIPARLRPRGPCGDMRRRHDPMSQRFWLS